MKKPVSVVADNRCADIFRQRYKLEPNIVPYGIDGEFFSQKQHNPSSRQFKIICPAMISPSKNQLDILKAVKVLQKYIPNIKVILSGYKEPSHPYSIMLDKYIAYNNIDVSFVLPTSREKVREVYSTANVGIFTGKGQGSWLSPFELLSMGVPVIVTPNLTCSDLIYQRNMGLVTDNIVSALLKVYNEYPEYKMQALGGQEYVLSELTWEKFGKRMENILCAVK